MTIKVLRWVELLILVAVATRAVPTSHPRRVPCNCAWLIDYKLTRACRLGERPTAVSSPCNSIIVVRQTDAGRAGPGTGRPGVPRGRPAPTDGPSGTVTTRPPTRPRGGQAEREQIPASLFRRQVFVPRSRRRRE